MQVLLIDGSTFTVGPGSDLVIDKFVYDPNKQTGKVVASMSKGVMRFVGGKISKNEDAVKVNTPAGALAIRGGMFQAKIDGPKVVASFLYGVALTLGNKYTVYEPGYTIDTTNGAPTIRPTTSADINAIMTALTNGSSGGVGAGTPDDSKGGQPGSKYTQVETLSLQDMVADATATQINDTIQEEESTPPPSDTTTPPPPPPPPPADKITLRVLGAPGVYTAFPGTSFEYTTDAAGEQEILGGGKYAELPLGAKHADDFVWTFDLVNGRMTGTVSGLYNSQCGEEGCQNVVSHEVSPAQVDFPGTLSCVAGICAVVDATVKQGDETTTFVGLAVLRPDFVAYQVVGLPNENSGNGPSADPLLMIGGKAYNFGEASGRTFAFKLLPDINQGGVLAPFAGPDSFPEVDVSTDDSGNYVKALPVISDLLYREKNGGAEDQSRAVWMQTSFYVNTTPGNGEDVQFDQQSFVNVALGGVGQDGGLLGARRGGSSVDFDTCNDGCINRESFAFTGDIASFAGPDGSHFLGKNEPNIVIGFDSTGTHNIGRDIPLEQDANSASQVQNQSGSTYHIGYGLGQQPSQAQTLQGTLKGYAVGMVTSATPPSFVNVVASTSPEDFAIAFNKTTNTLEVNLTVHSDIQGQGDAATDAYHIGFGDNPQSPANRSAYIDNQHYAAIEKPGATLVDAGFDQTWAFAQSTGYLASGAQLGVTNFFPETFGGLDPNTGAPAPFCTGCDFIQWGAWGARVEFGSSGPQYVDNVHLGWWVAGDITAATDLTELGNQFAQASYSGHAIGNVASLAGDSLEDLCCEWRLGDELGLCAPQRRSHDQQIRPEELCRWPDVLR